MADLSGKVALVTGSSRGLGRHYAHHLAQAGADVVIHDLRSDSAAEFGEAKSGEAVADEIRSFGRRSAFYPADLTDPRQTAGLVQQVVADFGRIDILVNNAGGDIGARTPRPTPNTALDIEPDDIRSVLERNLLTTMYACKYVGQHMRERRAGKIVNIGSVAGHLPAREGVVYAAAKAAIAHYTRCLAEELRPYEVNVNCLAPAPTYTGRFLATRSVPAHDDASRLRRVAQPEDMASIVLFLAGPESDRLTGETIVCW
ncbi:SDR family NAD(P)-dependent oxidoreductase [Thermasporomyces composti]|jgi:3-oxoacyl-[acyl-carrier protein] reductase|uniref:3-oxoacyl-[acyl-carrier protein] reductase n=1 Tax=Thermasporomyces composti TaxID=696763 RepID=A0A3D9V966_THECX|nr:SDR family oxidoreductase [Thermasporomyces composti]REF37243.1 3-oxoacyl-[acyl-carrier protein] reductase [Thermasporomyces composti]